MIGSLRKFRLLVNGRKPNIVFRSVVYTDYSVSSSHSQVQDSDNEADPSAVKTRTRLTADRTSLGSDMHGQYQPPDTTAADYVPFAVKQMRERMRAKYGLETQSDAAIKLEHTDSGMDTAQRRPTPKPSRGKLGNDYFDAGPTERRTRSYSTPETNTIIDDTVNSVKQPNRQELLQKYTFLNKQKVTDKVMDMTFGAIRLDSMNQPLYHGHRDRVHNDNIDVEPEYDFSVDHLSRHTEHRPTLPESMTNESRQQSNSYSDTIDTDYRADEPYSNSCRQTFVEREHTIDEHVGHKHGARLGTRGMSAPSDISYSSVSDHSHKKKANNDSFIDEQYFSTGDLLTPEESQHMSQAASDNFIEEQYFEHSSVLSDQQEPDMRESSTAGNIFGQYVNSVESAKTRSSEMSGNENKLYKPKTTHSGTAQQGEQQIITSNQNSTGSRASKRSLAIPTHTEDNLFDSQYFSQGDQISHSVMSDSDRSINDLKPVDSLIIDNTPTKGDYFDTKQEQRMSSNQNSTNNKSGKHSTVLPPRESFSKDNLFDSQYFSKEVSADETSHSVTTRSDSSVQNMKPTAVDSSTTHSTVGNTPTRGDYFGTMTKQEQRMRNQPVPDVKNPQTAFDLAMKLRLEKKGKLAGDVKEGLSPND